MATRGFTLSTLTLGTAQLGLSYGVANRAGLPDEAAAMAILDQAVAGGVRAFDTARAYGLSEARIGRWCTARPDADVTVITKFPSLAREVSPAEALDVSIVKSTEALGRVPDLLLAHRGEDLSNAAVLARLDKAVGQGLIGAFGASVYEPDVALSLLERVPVAALQVPLSILDRRFEEAGVLAMAAARGVQVHARSAFLQGALLMDEDAVPPHLAALAPVIRVLRARAGDWGFGLSELAIMAVLGTPGVSSVVVGVDHADQLGDHIAAAARPALTPAQRGELAGIVGGLPETVLDPSRWPR